MYIYIYHIMDFAELQFVKMSPRAVVPTKQQSIP